MYVQRRSPEPVPPKGWLERARAAPVTVALLAANIVVFAYVSMHGSTEDTWVLVRFGAVARTLVLSGEVWRLVTAMFLHIGFAHLALNTLFMAAPCAYIEREFGHRRFALLYVSAGVVGNACSVLFHDIVSAGASGAGYGLLGAMLVVRRRALGSFEAFAADAWVRATLISVLVWTGIGVQIHADFFAHLGGLAAGSALAWWMSRPPRV